MPLDDSLSPMEHGLDLSSGKPAPEDVDVELEVVPDVQDAATVDEAEIETPATVRIPLSQALADHDAAFDEPMETEGVETTTTKPDTDEVDREFLSQHRELQRQREELLKRRSQLDDRQAHVEQMYDQITKLHREALELQVSTESIWSELTEEFPSEELSARLAETRSRLADHYRLTNETLAERKDELHALREELTTQESRLRQQRRELQMWADRRYDDIETRTAQLIRRERELDRMESDFERQSIQWQQQRESYRQEIERLSWELRGEAATTTP